MQVTTIGLDLAVLASIVAAGVAASVLGPWLARTIAQPLDPAQEAAVLLLLRRLAAGPGGCLPAIDDTDPTAALAALHGFAIVGDGFHGSGAAITPLGRRRLTRAGWLGARPR